MDLVVGVELLPPFSVCFAFSCCRIPHSKFKPIDWCEETFQLLRSVGFLTRVASGQEIHLTMLAQTKAQSFKTKCCTALKGSSYFQLMLKSFSYCGHWFLRSVKWVTAWLLVLLFWCFWVFFEWPKFRRYVMSYICSLWFYCLPYPASSQQFKNFFIFSLPPGLMPLPLSFHEDGMQIFFVFSFALRKVLGSKVCLGLNFVAQFATWATFFPS